MKGKPLNKNLNKTLPVILDQKYCLLCDHKSNDIETHILTIHNDLCIQCSNCRYYFINMRYFNNHDCFDCFFRYLFITKK